MGLFTSRCPGCDAEIAWFLKAPENYVCGCGRPVSSEEIEKSWDKEYAIALVDTAKRRISKSEMSSEKIEQSISEVDRYLEEAKSGKRYWNSVSLFCNSVSWATAHYNKTYFEAILEYVKKETAMTQSSAMEYSQKQLDALLRKVAESDRGGVIEHQSIAGPVLPKSRKDRRSCVVVKVSVRYPDDSFTKIEFENPVDLDYTNKEDFFLDHVSV